MTAGREPWEDAVKARDRHPDGSHVRLVPGWVVYLPDTASDLGGPDWPGCVRPATTCHGVERVRWDWTHGHWWCEVCGARWWAGERLASRGRRPVPPPPPVRR